MPSNPIHSAQYKAVLKQSPLFKGLTDTTINELLKIFHRETWRRNTILDPIIFQNRFYLLIEGSLEVMRTNPETGKSFTLTMLEPGDGVDLLTLLNGHPHEIESVPYTDMVVLSTPLKNVQSWIENHPEFNHNFLPYLGEQIRKMEDLATDLALHDTMTRLARLFLRNIAPEQLQSKEDDQHLKLRHNLHDETLARMVGSVRQVINRHLQQWRKDNVLHKNRFSTEIIALEKLEKRAEKKISSLLHSKEATK